jgi:hypothetical protein
MAESKGATLRRSRLQTALGLLLAVLLAAPLLLSGGGLVAEPYFAVREGYKCSKCHVNKTGAGKRTDYAKVYMETRMAASGSLSESDAESSQGPSFGHGRLSDYFSISADMRQFAESRWFSGEGETWHFGRRGECESCHRSTDGGGKIIELYEQLEVAPGKASIVLGQSLLPEVSSRETFAVLDFGSFNGYLKAGIFRMPTGLRTTFDDPYLHGTVRFGAIPDTVGMEAVRGDGVEFGIEPGPWSVALSITNPAALNNLASAPERGKRVHLNAYAVGSAGLAGLTLYRDPVRETLERTFMGLYGGTRLGHFTTLGEFDAYKEVNPITGDTSNKLGLMAEVDFLFKRGHNIKWQYEAYDPDTAISKNRSDRTSLIYEPFYAPYLQVRGGVRRSAGPRDIDGMNGTTFFAELHLMY